MTLHKGHSDHEREPFQRTEPPAQHFRVATLRICVGLQTHRFLRSHSLFVSLAHHGSRRVVRTRTRVLNGRNRFGADADVDVDVDADKDVDVDADASVGVGGGPLRPCTAGLTRTVRHARAPVDAYKGVNPRCFQATRSSRRQPSNTETTHQINTPNSKDPKR